jgi:hydrogenase maturation protease
MTNTSLTLVVGIGSAHGDDQIGWLVADEIRAILSDTPARDPTEVHNAKSPLDLFNWLGENADRKFYRLLICDACRGLGETGSTRRWLWPTGELQNVCFSGTHDFGLAAALQLAEQLGRLPSIVSIWGIQIDHVQPGSKLSESLCKIPLGLAHEMLNWEPEVNLCESPPGQSVV